MINALFLLHPLTVSLSRLYPWNYIITLAENTEKHRETQRKSAVLCSALMRLKLVILGGKEFSMQFELEDLPRLTQSRYDEMRD